MSENTYETCVIAGKAVAELPWGMDEGHPDCAALKLTLLNKIALLSKLGVKNFICNGEYGVGFFAAEAVIALRTAFDIRLFLYMPFERQADKYSREVRERFFNIHKKSDCVEIINTQEYEGCCFETDSRMIDDSDLLLTDSEDSYITRYAVKQGVKVELIERLPLGAF